MRAVSEAAYSSPLSRARARIEVGATREFPFDKVANDPRIAFVKTGGSWSMTIRDPRLERREAD
jgi:hypothetical protein